MIRDAHADGEFSVEDGAGGHRHAGFFPAVGKGQSSGDDAAVHPVVTGSMRK